VNRPAGHRSGRTVQTGPVSAARLITATERERPQSGHELSRAQEWCSASQLAHRYERCNRTSLLMLTLEP